MEIITFVAIKIEKIPYRIANKIVHLIQIASFGHFVNQNKEGTKGSASWKPKEIMLQRMQILHLGPKIVICPIQGQVCHQERCILGYPNIFGLTVFNFSKKNSNLLFIYVILVVFQKFQKFFFQKDCNEHKLCHKKYVRGSIWIPITKVPIFQVNRWVVVIIWHHPAKSVAIPWWEMWMMGIIIVKEIVNGATTSVWWKWNDNWCSFFLSFICEVNQTK